MTPNTLAVIATMLTITVIMLWLYEAPAWVKWPATILTAWGVFVFVSRLMAGEYGPVLCVLRPFHC